MGDMDRRRNASDRRGMLLPSLSMLIFIYVGVTEERHVEITLPFLFHVVPGDLT